MMWSRIFLIVKTGLIVILPCFTTLSYSQESSECDLKFIDHLVNMGNYEEALFLIDSSDCSTIHLNDSINYLKGWCLYSLKRLLPSSESLVQVSCMSEFYLKSHFFAAYNYAHLGSYADAQKTLSEIKVISEKEISLRNYEIAGVNLLQGNDTIFTDYFSKTNKSFYELSGSSENIQKIYGDLRNHKSKSPLIAGVLSGIIPGSGKFYAGKKGEAISAFISTVGLGLVTWENYRKSGLNSFKTIAFGSAFAFSYTANIYGAVVTVNVLETEYRNNVKNSILFNLHIPLRNYYDK
jgi:TM2 domain-containing membrane protein YozV